MGDLLFFLRDGSPSTEEEVYERGGFQTDEEGARFRGLLRPAAEARSEPELEEKHVPRPPADKAFRRRTTKRTSR